LTPGLAIAGFVPHPVFNGLSRAGFLREGGGARDPVPIIRVNLLERGGLL